MSTPPTGSTSSSPSTALAVPPARRRRALFAATAIGLSIFAAFLILELATRIVLVRYAHSIDKLYDELAARPGHKMELLDLLRLSTNDQRVYVMRPGLNGVFGGVPLRTNTAGFRDDEHPITKPPETYRIAVLGDSVAFGWGVPVEERWSDQLEFLLNRPSGERRDDSASSAPVQKVEVLNFAVPGYNSVMQLATLRDAVLQYDPDMVLVNIVGNDAELPNFVRAKPNLWALNRLFLWEVVHDRLAGLEIGYTARQAGGGLVMTPGFREEEVPEKYRPLVGIENARKALKEMAEELGRRGIDVYAFVYESHLDKYLGRGPVRSSDRGWKGNVWTEAAQEAGMPVIDTVSPLLDHLTKTGMGESAFWVDPQKDSHPNPQAHRLIAERLAAELRETVGE